jgi:hypothetical protein
MAVGQAHAWFTPAFLARMEPCSPFRFAFLRERRHKLEGERGLFQRLFEIVLSSDDRNAPALHAPGNPTLSVPAAR